MSYLDVFKKKLTVFAGKLVVKRSDKCCKVKEVRWSGKCPGVIGWKANARPPGWKFWENAPLLPGGGWALLELTDALMSSAKASDNSFHSLA